MVAVGSHGDAPTVSAWRLLDFPLSCSFSFSSAASSPPLHLLCFLSILNNSIVFLVIPVGHIGSYVYEMFILHFQCFNEADVPENTDQLLILLLAPILLLEEVAK